MKKVVLAVAAVSVLAGCAQRPLNDYDRAALLGASESAALANARAAAFDGKEIGSDNGKGEHHHHHNHRSTGWEDENNVDNDVVYRNGKKGYYTADGEFVQYAQSAHKHQHHDSRHDTSLKQLSAEADAVMNGTIKDGAEFLIGQGWKANNGKWHKGGYTLTLIVEDGIIVNSQLSK